jgi:hypothetical protein
VIDWHETARDPADVVFWNSSGVSIMLVTNHVLSGAVIGAVVREPLVALPLGVGSHFLLDSMPHWGRWGSRERFLRIAVADGLTGLAVMGAACAVAGKGRRLGVLAGMVGAASPDLDKPATLWFGRTLWPEPVRDFHRRIQDEAPDRFYSHEVVAGTAFGATYLAVALGARLLARRR